MVKKHYSSWKTLMEKGIPHIAAAIMEQACQNRSIRLNTIEKLTMLLIIKLQYHFYLLFVSDINLYFYIFHRFFLNKLYQIHFKLGSLKHWNIDIWNEANDILSIVTCKKCITFLPQFTFLFCNSEFSLKLLP